MKRKLLKNAVIVLSLCVLGLGIFSACNYRKYQLIFKYGVGDSYLELQQELRDGKIGYYVWPAACDCSGVAVPELNEQGIVAIDPSGVFACYYKFHCDDKIHEKAVLPSPWLPILLDKLLY